MTQRRTRFQPGKKRRYIRGFDGLRTLGVIGVILYHIRPDLFPGGYLGVPIFMVVSGYLITDGLLIEYDRSRTIDFKSFFIRRFKRLYPGLLAVLFATSAYIALFAHNLLHNLHMMVLTNLLSVYNWWQIANGQSYFARFANGESPFTHLWTLSIEGQYYLIWPFLVLGLLALVKDRQRLGLVTFGLAMVSAIWMTVLYATTVKTGQGAFDPSRLYYGTDTRAFSILFGAALAFVWPSRQLSTHISRPAWLTLDALGVLSLVSMAVMYFNVNAQSAFLYEGGMLLFSLATMVLVAVVAHPAAHFDRLLSNPVFSYIGSRSYGLYLYQFPIMIFFENRFRDLADHPLLYPVIEVALILLFAELSYRYIEQPLAHFDRQHFASSLRSLFDLKRPMIKQRVVVVVATAIVLTGSVGIAMAPQAKAADDSPLEQRLKAHKETKREKEKRIAAAQASVASEKKAPVKIDAEKRYEEQAKTHPVNQNYEQYGLTQVQLQQAQDVGLTAIGDSVMLDGQPELQQLFPKALIDATVSRQMVAGIDVLSSYAQRGALADNVLIGLGTNGPFTPAQLDQLMQVVGPKRQVFWINVHVPTRSWQNDVNQVLKTATSKYQNLTIIDWYDASKAHQDWFYDDLVHPNQTGNPQYAALITKTIVTKLF